MFNEILKVGFGYVIVTLVTIGLSLVPMKTIEEEQEEAPLHSAVVEEKIEESKQEEPKVEEPKQQEKKEKPKVKIKKVETSKKQEQKTIKSPTTEKKPSTIVQKSQATGKYKITHYGWDCCKSGVTATGYNVRNTIYYNDKQYGKVRIVAMHGDMPLYSIIKIKNYKYGGDIVAIVIDRGVGRGTIDLLVENEATASKYGIQKNVSIEILRKGK